MTMDAVRTRWAAGEPAFALWLTLDGAGAAATAAAAGPDAVVVDLQHGHATIQDFPHLLAAIEPTPAMPFVRASANDPAELMRALDLGARGVICPMVGSQAEAEAFVGACRYPPAGTRSYGPIHAAFGRGREQTESAESAVLLFAMIETADGLAAADEIAATPGLDALFVGPADLSLATGLEKLADLTDPDLLKLLGTIVEIADRHGIVAGVHAPAPPRAAEMAARGFRFVSCAVDDDLLATAAAEAVRAARDTR
ncbi:MAG TPA: aldolase/citrate lyase family protein [Actinomycetota bacterium]|nr:aldolase/citrate lyase family protein [Actinomycetota bacterium]